MQSVTQKHTREREGGLDKQAGVAAGSPDPPVSPDTGSVASASGCGTVTLTLERWPRRAAGIGEEQPQQSTEHRAGGQTNNDKKMIK